MSEPTYTEMKNFLRNEGWESFSSGEAELWRSPDKKNVASVYVAFTYAKNEQQALLREDAVVSQAKIICNKCGNDLAQYSRKSFVGYYGLVHTT